MKKMGVILFIPSPGAIQDDFLHSLGQGEKQKKSTPSKFSLPVCATGQVRTPFPSFYQQDK